MRIESIDLKGFGALRDLTLRPGPGLTLFYGANEAGKSTLMGFIRATLFGFPPRGSSAGRYEPLHGGVHGGSLTLLDRQGQRILVERYAGGRAGAGSASEAGARGRSSSGTVKVTLGDGTAGGEELLRSLLGGMSGELYRSLFAFGLSELQELRTLQSEEISGYLYSAGLGTTGRAIMETERKLAAEMEQLFKPRGRNQEIHRLLQEIEETEGALRRGREQAGRYNEWTAAAEELSRRIEEADAARSRAAGEAAWLELCLKAGRHWPRLLELRRELDELPAIEAFPEDAVPRWEALGQESERLLAEREAKLRRSRQLQASLQALSLQPQLLARKAELDAMLERISSYQDGIVRAAELRAEARQREQELRGLLRQIDERWDARALAAFPATVAGKELVRRFQRRLAEQERQLSLLSAEALRAAEQYRRAQREKERQRDLAQRLAESLSARYPWPDRLPEADLPAAIGQARKLFRQWRQAEDELQSERRREQDRLRYEELLANERAAAKPPASRTHRPVMWTVAAAVLLPASLLVFGQKTAALTAFILLAAAAAVLFPRSAGPSGRSDRPFGGGGSPEVSPRVQQQENQARLLKQELQSQTEWLSGALEAAVSSDAAADGGRFETILDEWQSLVEDWRREKGELAHQESRLTEMNEALEEEARILGELEAKEIQAEEELAKVRSQWMEWLEQMGLQPSLTPETAGEVFLLVEQGQQAMQLENNALSKLRLLESEQKAFKQKAAEYLGTQAESDPVTALKKWKEAAEEQVRLLELQANLQSELSSIESELLDLNGLFERNAGKMSRLLEEAGASGEEELRSRAAVHARRMRLKHELLQLKIALETTVGRDQLDRLAACLESKDLDTLQEEARSLQERLAALEQECGELRDRRGRVRRDIEALEAGREHGENLQRYQEQLASLQAAADRWMILSFSLNLLRKAREVYEKERQPGVLVRASHYFAELTGGRYQRIVVPMDEQRLMAVQDGRLIDTALLSRGTAEALYLAMRLSLADEYARTVTLPIVMDDIFVNFDRERMERSLILLRSMSEKHQILLFTCHPHVRDAAVRWVPGHTGINL